MAYENTNFSSIKRRDEKFVIVHFLVMQQQFGAFAYVHVELNDQEEEIEEKLATQ